MLSQISSKSLKRILNLLNFATFNGPILDKKWREQISKLPVYPEGKTVQFLFPPPNVTGSLHLGHALTGAIQDSIARFESLNGKNVSWIPGFDHAGIATLAMVKNQKSTAFKDNDQLLKELERFSSESKDNIRNQLKAMGFSLDWSKEYFTMNEDYSTFVQECFVNLFERGFIYRNESFINWSPASKSALADVEVETVALEGRTHLQIAGGRSFQFGIIYKIEFSSRVAVFTTRPETCFGDVALAVHPSDERYKEIVGTLIMHPITGKNIPIVADEAVNMEFASGILKITPFHSALDYEIASRNGLLHSASKVIDEAGCIVAREYPEYHGKDRFTVRTMLSNAFKLEQHEHKMNLQICRRTKDIIEQMRCPQWFFKSSAFRQELIDLNLIGMEIFPLHHRKRWKQWVEEMKDWCISRQIVWGNSIPVYFIRENSISNEIFIAALTEEEAKVKAKEKFGIDVKNPEFRCKKEADVLDTWFSSCLAPIFATDGEIELMETGHDILYFWVIRMVILSLALREKVPFHRLMLHPMLKSRLGKKMSKSEPHGIIDPLDIIFKNEKNPSASGFGTDALRIALLGHSINELFMSFDPHNAKIACHFGKKLENCAHFIEKNQISILQESNTRELPWKIEFSPENFNHFEHYLASKYNEMLMDYKKGFKEFEIFKSLKAVQTFVLDELCRNHIEYSKAIFYSSAIRPENKLARISFLRAIFLRFCVLLSPFCPVLVHELLEKFDELNMIRQPDTSMALAPIDLGNAELAATNTSLVNQFYSILSTPMHKRTETTEEVQKFIDLHKNVFLHMQAKRPANILYMS
jgi:valyl-tRNA synthetase